jgi:hypothetical protein
MQDNVARAPIFFSSIPAQYKDVVRAEVSQMELQQM